jgi:hypothetical protein
MKKFIKRFWGVGLVVIILSSLFVSAAPVFAADPLRWESKSGGPSPAFNAISNGNTVLSFAVASNAATMYAATVNASGTGGKLWQSVNGGSVWTEITSRLPNYMSFGSVRFVALAPDDANILVVVTNNATTGNNVIISTNGGTTFTDMVLTTVATQSVKGLNVSALVTGGFRYIAVYGSTTGTNDAELYYYNYGSGVGGWFNAVVTANVTGRFIAPGPAAAATIDNIVALQFSPNFASDYMAVALSEQTGGFAADNGTLRLHVLSFNSKSWDATAVGAAYPVVVTAETSPFSAFNVNKAAIGLAPDYMGGDETLRIAFVGADITGIATSGGIWRCNDVQAAKNLISGVGISSVAFDGTNLAAGAYASNNAYHSSDPLGSSPTVIGARTFKRIGVDDASVNDNVLVMFVGATLFGSKQGKGGAISKSTDSGNTWNDFTMINMNIGSTSTWDDVLVSGDGATWYVAVHDANISCVFRVSPMQRVLCTDISLSSMEFRLRGISTDANVIYAFDYLGNTIYYSADGGVSRWQQRLNTPATIGDLAVESANVIYIGASNAPDVYKSINNGFTWNTAVNTNLTSGGNIYTMLSLKENYVIVGGTAGAVSFSKDGGTTWTKLGPGVAAGSTGTLVAASGLDTGNFIFAATANSKTIYRCEIGPSNPINELKDMNLTTQYPQNNAETTSGLIYQSGVLYATSVNTTAGAYTYLNSTLYPTMAPGGVHPPTAWRTQYSSAVPTGFLTYGLVLNTAPTALKVSTSTGKITLYAVNTYGLAAPGTISKGVRYYDDTLALTGPTLSGPADKALIQTNSVTGNPMNVNLMWARASLATSYDIQVALDSNFNSLASFLVAYTGVDGTAATMAVVYNSATYGFNPGTTYYWRIRANTPISSVWSETRSLTIQPVAAAVPAISSPANGATISNQSPAFSWTPVTGTTKYEFQLSTTPTFGTTVLTDTPASAGTLVPVTIKLDQGKQYFWRVRALEPIQGDWSTVANFLVATPAPPAKDPVVITQAAPVTITIPPAPPAQTVTLNPPKVEQIAPTYIWAIIIIGAILVIAVIVLIVRTRRSV